MPLQIIKQLPVLSSIELPGNFGAPAHETSGNRSGEASSHSLVHTPKDESKAALELSSPPPLLGLPVEIHLIIFRHVCEPIPLDEATYLCMRAAIKAGQIFWASNFESKNRRAGNQAKGKSSERLSSSAACCKSRGGRAAPRKS